MKQILLMLIAVVMVGCGKKEAGKPQAQPDVKAPSTSAPKEPTLQTKPTELTGAEKEFSETKAKAEAGEAWAQYNIGWMYGVGKGVEQDDKESTKWYQKAADQEYARAQSMLGWNYQNGEG
ncbi:MAG: tetratricopeptide repeat protein, partial [Verrucomicrobiota bacterium]|nr:tetratricopeptide repeat protein [Verrucomicrobiota bacterium]